MPNATNLKLKIEDANLQKFSLIFEPHCIPSFQGIFNKNLERKQKQDILENKYISVQVNNGKAINGIITKIINKDTALIEGKLIEKNLDSWFTKKDRNKLVKIYQRLSQKEENSEKFLKKIFSNKNFSIQDKTISDNVIQEYFSLILNKTHNRLDEIKCLLNQICLFNSNFYDWYLTGNNETPIVFIFGDSVEEIAVKIDEKWNHQNEVKPSFYQKPEEKEDLILFKNFSDKISKKLFEKLCKGEHATEEFDGIPGPCFVKYNDDIYFAKRVIYEWNLASENSMNQKEDKFTIYLHLDSPHREFYFQNKIEPITYLEGEFINWESEEDGEKHLHFVPGDSNWRVVKENGELDENQTLVCSAIMPGVSEKELKGLYIKHQPGDKMCILFLNDSSIPIALGGMQHYKKENETVNEDQNVDIRLHAENLAITSIETTTTKAKSLEMNFKDNLHIGKPKEGNVVKATQEEIQLLENSTNFTKEEVKIVEPGAIIKKDNVNLAGKVEIK